MPLSFQVLGRPRADNALFVKLDTGRSQTRFLFDCGDGCPQQLPAGELRAVDHLCLSHLHLDHVARFDAFFRVTFDRAAPENHIWVPHGSGAIIHHRFRGFMWNLVDEKQSGEWFVHEIAPTAVRTASYLAREAFRTAHPRPEYSRNDGPVLAGDGFTLDAVLLDHGTPSVGYVVRELPRVNVDAGKLLAAGLQPGPWVKRLRGPPAAEGETVTVDGAARSLGALQAELLVRTPGDSIAYLTDFRMTPATSAALASRLRGVNTVVCECQYRAADAALADRVMHSTAVEVAGMAAAAGVGRLILFHFSDRYEADERREMRDEARAVFANAHLPEGW